WSMAARAGGHSAMVDRPLTRPPGGASRGDYRTLRSRQAAMGSAMDLRRSQRQSDGTPRMLVKVFDSGAMPSAPDFFYSCHPVQINGCEVEGVSASFVVQTDETLYVDVLHQAADEGDILTAYHVGGRWVAEKLDPTGDRVRCQACDIPFALTLTWTNHSEVFIDRF